MTVALDASQLLMPAEVECATVAASMLTPPPEHLPVLDDGGLAQALRQIADDKHQALVIVNAYTACLLRRSKPEDRWQASCVGELGSEAVEACKPLVRKGLWWSSVAGAPWDADPESVETTVGSVTLLNRWLKESNRSTGREGDVTHAIKEELNYLAAWRCQFTGCGRDLKRHGATGTRGRFSYFAHIVAASPDGPRGDPIRSKLLASDPNNFMLLCDECHRLIDKRDPAKYTVELLTQMREDSIAEVRRLLDSLQHKPVEVIAILGNIAGQPAQLSMDDVDDALRGQSLRSARPSLSRYFSPGASNHAVHTAEYWGSLFRQLKTDLPLLQTLLDGSRTGAARPRLAVFPLHGTSALVLAGRVLGDAAGVHIFQPHRNTVGFQTRWAWPDADVQPLPPKDKFKLDLLKAHLPGQDEAILVVGLTADVAATRMPPTCAVDGELVLPALRIAGPAFNKDCIQRPEDIQVFALAVDEAIRVLQDQWQVRKVHLFVSAPASASLVVGQKLQARHHAVYTCYESEIGVGASYKPTIEISPESVRELVSGQANFLTLQF